MTPVPFNRRLDLVVDVADEPIPGVRRVMANNSGPSAALFKRTAFPH